MTAELTLNPLKCFLNDKNTKGSRAEQNPGYRELLQDTTEGEP